MKVYHEEVIAMLENLQIMQEPVTSFNLLIWQFGKEIELEKIIEILVTAGRPRKFSSCFANVKTYKMKMAIIQ